MPEEGVYHIKRLSIKGFRGFGKEAVINFAVPNGVAGSGLTFLVGSNNSGKSSILEALMCFNKNPNKKPTFSVGKRNINSDGGLVKLLLETQGEDEKCYKYSIESEKYGGSHVRLSKDDSEVRQTDLMVYYLQSRRYVALEFDNHMQDRNIYLQNYQNNGLKRTYGLDFFQYRLVEMQSHHAEIDPLLKKILGYDLKWTIDENENSMSYLKFTINGCTHTSEGVGDGIWSIFTICDALYDSRPGSIIAIDEPELSLHPAYQKRIIELLKSYSKDRQIIISTHSPYFVDWEAILNSAFLNRCVKSNEGNIEIYQLSDESKENIRKIINDTQQPHTLGLEAKEIFFLEDNIILVEGQEDVVMYKKIAEQLHMQFIPTFFGWGVGGAPKMKCMIDILKKLGYKKIQIIFDGDKESEKKMLEKDYSEYKFYVISTDDIRDKKAKLETRTMGQRIMDSKNVLQQEIYRKLNKDYQGYEFYAISKNGSGWKEPKIVEPKQGIVDENGNLKPEYKEKMEELINSINHCGS